MEEEELVPIDDSPIVKDSINLANIKNIILIDKTIETPEIFFSSNSDDTLPIYYNCSTDRDKLFDYLEKEFVNITRIGFIFDNSMMNNKYFLNNEIFFTENDLIQFENNKESLEDYSSNVSFLIKLIKKFDIKNIDFLACNSLEYDNWKKYYELLQYYSTTIIGASKDLTGNINYGANWIMENTNEDIQHTYFNENITNYSSTLARSSVGYNITSGTTTKGRSVFLFIIETTNNFTNLVLNNFSNLVFQAGVGGDLDTRYKVHYREENTGSFILATDLDNLNINLLPTKRYEIILNFANSKTTTGTSAYYRYNGISQYTSRTVVLASSNELKMYPSLSHNVLFSTFDPNNTTSYNAIKNENNTKYQNLTLNYTYDTTTVSPVAPTLSNFSIPDGTYGSNSFPIINPSSNSQGSFSFESSNTSVAIISGIKGDEITIISPGISIITATQAAKDNYTSGSINATFKVNQATPTIKDFFVPDKTNKDIPFQITAPESNSQGSFTYESSNVSVAIISEIKRDEIIIVSPGISIITATQKQTINYYSGTIKTTFTVIQAPLQDLVNTKSPVAEILAAGYTNQKLLDDGFTASIMRSNGYDAKDLKLLDYSVRQMKQARFSLSSLLRARFRLGKITAYYGADKFLALGIDEDQLRKRGVSEERLKEMGFPIDPISSIAP